MHAQNLQQIEELRQQFLGYLDYFLILSQASNDDLDI